MELKFVRALSLLLLLMLFLGQISILNSAEKVRVVEGLIEDITENSIKVNDSYYNIAGVPLIGPSEERVSKDQLKIGRRVALFLKGENITTILIFGEDFLE